MTEQEQPKFYKLMNQEYVDRFLRGEVKFGTIDEYRGHKDRQTQIEALHQAAKTPPDSEIHFAFLEHLRKEKIPNQQPKPQGIEDYWEGVDCYDIEPSADGRSYGNVVSTTFPNMAIFCGSHELTPKVVKTMRAASMRHGGQRYDRCVPIVDPTGFFDVLTAALVKYFGIKRPVKAYVQHVVYAPKRMPTSVFVAPTSSGPFRKLSNFRNQREIRYVLDYALPEFVQGTVISMGTSVEQFCGETINLDEAFPESQQSNAPPISTRGDFCDFVKILKSQEAE